MNNNSRHNRRTNAWRWIPSLYFTEGLPYTLVVTTSVILYKKLEISNADIAYYTGWLYFPWVIKPLWSPFIDLFKTKRWWIVLMQLLMGSCMAGVAFLIPTSFFFQATLAILWLAAFSSATHDIAADGFYMLGLMKEQQAFFIGIRNTSYRLAMIFGQGILVILAGYMEKKTGNIPFSWSIAFFISAGILVLSGIYHQYMLPKPQSDMAIHSQSFTKIYSGFKETFLTFFKKEGILIALFFILTYRLAESQLVKIAPPFLLDKQASGGLGIDTETYGFIYGILGLIALLLGGILGGVAISKNGLKKWIWPMAMALSLPNLVYVYLSYALPSNIYITGFCVAVEQFGYGFGFTSFTMYLMIFSEGKYKTSHFAFCTGLMAAGMMLPGMASGWIQEQIGYQHFFLWVILCTIPGFIATGLVKKKLKDGQ